MSGRASPRFLRSLGLLAACALLALPGTAEAGQRVCAAAMIEEPFILPDGSEHSAGSLKICRLQAHYPNTTLLVSYVNGQNIGMLLGTIGHNEAGRDADPFMIFAREPDGRLRLYGYGLHEGSGVTTFTLDRPDRRRTAPLPPSAAPAHS